MQPFDNLALPLASTRQATDQSTWITSKMLRRLWWVVFAALIAIGALLFASGYRHGLPFVDYPDEMTVWTFGHSYMDPSWPLLTPNYPPGFIFVSSIIQRAQYAATGWAINVADTIAILRLLSVIATVITLGMIMLLAYRFAGPIAGIVAGICWIAFPLAHEEARLALVNAWLGMFVVASLAVGIEGWARKSTRWLVASFILGFLAAIFKWQGGAVLGVAGLATLTFWNVNRRRSLALMAVYAVVMAVFAFWAVVIYHALAGGTYLPDAQPTPPTPLSLFINLQHQMAEVGPFLIFGALPLCALILGWILPTVRKQLYVRYAFWILPLVIVAYNVVLSFSGAPVFDRHYIAGSAILCCMAGVGFALLLQAIYQITQRLKLQQPITGVVFAAVTILLVILLSNPLVAMAANTYSILVETQRPDTRVFFAQWASSTVTGPVAITDEDLAASIQTLYGYQGKPIYTPFNKGTAVRPTLDQLTGQILPQKQVRYVVTWAGAFDAQAQKPSTPLIRLLSFGQDTNVRGTRWEADYVGSIAEPRNVTFGSEIVLRGFNLSAATVVCAGDPVTTQFFWGPAAQPSRYYSSYLHLTQDRTGEQSYPINGDPLADGDRPTVSWIWPGELLVGPSRTWNVPADLEPGNYHLWLGVFDPASGQRLTLASGQNHYEVTTIRVMDCKSTF